MSGLTSATLVGVPLAAWLGQHLGCRSAFVLDSAIAAVACVLICRGVPDVPAAHGASPLRELGALARTQVGLTLGIGAIGFGGMFAVLSDIKPLLTAARGWAAWRSPPAGAGRPPARSACCRPSAGS